MKALFAISLLSLIAAIPTAVALAESAVTQVQIGTALVCYEDGSCTEK